MRIPLPRRIASACDWPGIDCAGTPQQAAYAGDPKQELMEKGIDGFVFTSFAPRCSQEDRDVRWHLTSRMVANHEERPAFWEAIEPSPPTGNTPRTAGEAVGPIEGKQGHGWNPPGLGCHRQFRPLLNYAPPLPSDTDPRLQRL